jgi:HEAT repeat protein
MAQYPDVFSPEYVFAIRWGFGMAKAVTVLKALSERWPDEPQKRWEVVQQIIKPLALESLKDRDWATRAAASSALAEMGAKDVIPQILPLLNDPHPRVREIAKKALQKLGYHVK